MLVSGIHSICTNLRHKLFLFFLIDRQRNKVLSGGQCLLESHENQRRQWIPHQTQRLFRDKDRTVEHVSRAKDNKVDDKFRETKSSLEVTPCPSRSLIWHEAFMTDFTSNATEIVKDSSWHKCLPFCESSEFITWFFEFWGDGSNNRLFVNHWRGEKDRKLMDCIILFERKRWCRKNVSYSGCESSERKSQALIPSFLFLHNISFVLYEREVSLGNGIVSFLPEESQRNCVRRWWSVRLGKNLLSHRLSSPWLPSLWKLLVTPFSVMQRDKKRGETTKGIKRIFFGSISAPRISFMQINYQESWRRDSKKKPVEETRDWTCCHRFCVYSMFFLLISYEWCRYKLREDRNETCFLSPPQPSLVFFLIPSHFRRLLPSSSLVKV